MLGFVQEKFPEQITQNQAEKSAFLIINKEKMTENKIVNELAEKIDIDNPLGKEIKRCDSQVDLKLKRIVENIEKLEEEKKEVSRQISYIYKEAKGFGFDTKAIRKVISLRKMDSDKRIELEELTQTYKEALGMLG